MKPTTRNWILFAGLVCGTLASSLHAQSKTTTRTFSSSGPGTMTVYTSTGGMTRVSQGGEDPQVKDDLFAGTEQFSKNATDVTEINMGPDTLDSVTGHRSSEARNTVLKIVRSYEYDKPGLYDMAAVEQFRNKLNTGDWHCSVHTRNMKTGESTDVCSKHRTDGFREEAIITIEAKELTFIHTITKIPAGDSSGHSALFNDDLLPLVMGHLHGLAAMAVASPDALMDMAMARTGVLGKIQNAEYIGSYLGPYGHTQGLMDLRMDTFRVMRDSQMAAIRPMTDVQIRNMQVKLKEISPMTEEQIEDMRVAVKENMHIDVDPDVEVHITPDPHPEPHPDPQPAPEAAPAEPAFPAMPAEPAAPAAPAPPAAQPE